MTCTDSSPGTFELGLNALLMVEFFFIQSTGIDTLQEGYGIY